MHREDRPTDIRKRIEDAVATIAHRLAGNEQRRTVLGSLVERLTEIVRTAGGACAAAASGNPSAATGVLQSLGGTLETIALEIEGALTERDVRIAAHEADAATAATHAEALEQARKQLQASIVVERGRWEQTARDERTALERELAERDARIVALETLTATTADALIQRLAEFSRTIPERIDAHLKGANDLEQALLRLKNDVQDLTEFEEVAVDGVTGQERRALDVEIAALAADIAPIRAAYHNIAPEQLVEMEQLRARYRLVVDQYHELQSLIDALTKEVERHDGAHRTAATSWAAVDRDVLAATNLFPRLFQQDPFALAGTTNAEVGRKRGAYAVVQQRCDALMGEIQAMMSVASIRYRATKDALERNQTDIEQLLAYHEASEYETLPTEDQRRIRAVVLTFQTNDRSLSARAFVGILARAGECPSDETGAALITAALRPEFFEPAAPAALQAQMQVFRLTDRGRYWREVWAHDDPGLVERLADARRAWESDVAAAEARAVQERDARKAERDAQRAARAAERDALARQRAELAAAKERPATIVTRLNPGEREVLAIIIAAIPSLRETSRASDLPRVVAAGIAARAIKSLPPRTIAAALRRLRAFRPALLAASSEYPGRYAPTPLAERVAELLPTIPPDVVESTIRIVQTKVKWWFREHRKRYHAIQTILAQWSGTKTADDEV